MPESFFPLLEATIIASSLSLDTFMCGFAYGSTQMKIPGSSRLVINATCAAVTGVSLMAGSLFRAFIPPWGAKAVSFIALFAVGMLRLADSATKSMIEKYNSQKVSMSGSLFSFRFVLTVYADCEKADADGSQSISAKEAMLLALSLSLDALAVGFGAALAGAGAWWVFGCSTVANALFLKGGLWLGRRMASISKWLTMNISWLGGIAFIAIAILRLL